VAVEPQPVFADIIGMHLAGRLKGFERVAVGAGEGEAVLHISSRHTTVTTISDRFIKGVSHADGFRNVIWDREIRLPMTTLDRLIDKYGPPAFCKIDVEDEVTRRDQAAIEPPELPPTPGLAVVDQKRAGDADCGVDTFNATHSSASAWLRR